MTKNIVIFSDGTCQEGGQGTNGNVYKLFNMIEDRTDRQIAFYDRGPGTGWRKLTGKAFGAGHQKICVIVTGFYSITSNRGIKSTFWD